ncbi:MAG: type II toxin-antitoxin system RelE/ParE family toxin [Burkholderiales bacterium]
MAWKIEYGATALKQLGKLDKQVAKQIVDYLDKRVAATGEPRAAGKALKGSELGEFWRYRVGDCRIIASIEDKNLTILALQIGNRREIYRSKK